MSYFKGINSIRDTGKSVTEAEYKEHLARIQVYRVWFDKNIMPLSSKNGSDTVMILPFGTATPHYRTDTPRYGLHRQYGPC